MSENDVVLGEGKYAVLTTYRDDGVEGSLVFRKAKKPHPIGDAVVAEDGGADIGADHDPHDGDVRIRVRNAESWAVLRDAVAQIGSLMGWTDSPATPGEKT